MGVLLSRFCVKAQQRRSWGNKQ